MNLDFEQFEKARKIRIPSVCEELAEDIGIQIGDGSVNYRKNNKDKGSYRIQVYGNITEDRHYLINFVKPLKEKLFGIKVYSNENKVAGTIFLTIYSKNLVYFYNSLGFPIGPKINIKIPSFILMSKKLQISCLRGLIDTDGTLAFRKGDYPDYSFPIVKFSSKSKDLCDQICGILDNLRLSYTVQFDIKQYDKRTKRIYIKNEICVQGKKNLEKWMEIIGFHNIAQITKYLIYKKLGYCPPRTTLEQRLHILKKEKVGQEGFEFGICQKI